MTTYSLDDVRGMVEGKPQTFSLADVQGMQQEAFRTRMIARETNDLSSGLRRGARDVIDTGAEGLAWLYDKATGADMATGEHARVRAMNQKAKDEWKAGTGGEILPVLQRFGGNVLATTPIMGGAGAAVESIGLPALGRAIGSAGMTTGRSLPPAADVATRMVGGGINGYATGGMVDPSTAETAGIVGALLPPALKGMNLAGTALARPSAASQVPESVLQAARAGREAGYVIPPTQVRPTLLNRAVEGMAGKLSTAQNASAMNQPVTNRLAAGAIGADDLTAESIAAVRAKANSAYDALGRAGAFQADDTFRDALQRAGGASQQLRKDFPELAHKEIDSLIDGLASRQQFNAQSTIEAIKRLRFEGSANKGASDPAKRALGSAQMKVSNALEDLIDRNLKAAGADDLLGAYREARTTLAKVYDVEKALNSASGNVDAQKIAKMADKGRPLTGDLKTIADFARQFPKANQTVERMGSLPQLSPLDFGFAGMSGGAEGLLARPAARSLALSPLVQNRLGLAVPPSGASRIGGLLGGSDDLLPLLYRGAPLIVSQ